MSATRTILRLFRSGALTLTLSGVALCSGCLFGGGSKSAPNELAAADEPEPSAHASKKGSAGQQHQISLEELDRLAHAYADRYDMVITSATEALKRGNTDPVQRRRALQLRLHGVQAMNDIVSGNDPYLQSLDLVVSVTLQSTVWIDENRAQEVFGDRAPILIRALRTTRVEAWGLAGKLLTQDQLEQLDFIIMEWRRLHPEVEDVAFVKFDSFAGAHVVGLLNEIKAGGGFLAPLNQMSLAIKDWRRMTDRVFWYTKRAPNLAAIEAEDAVSEILSAPEVQSIIRTADQVGKTVEAMPQTIERQRKEMLSEFDERNEVLTNTLREVRQVISEANALGHTASQFATNAQQTLAALGDTLQVAGSVGHSFHIGQPSTKPPPVRRFDIQDYSAALERLNEAITNLHQLSLGADQLTRSDGYNKVLQDLKDVTDRRVDHVVRSLCLAFGLAFVLAVLYRIISLKLERRLAPREREKP